MVKLLLLFQKKEKKTKTNAREMPGGGWARFESTEQVYKPHSAVRTVMSK